MTSNISEIPSVDSPQATQVAAPLSPVSPTRTRTILVTGATGQQGRGFIRAVLSTPAASDFNVLGLTRNLNSNSAKRLADAAPRVELAQADLDDATSVRKVFEEKGKGGFWGVFLVLAFPGLGADVSGEIQQGKLVADLCKEFDVKHLIYSSHERGGESFDDETSKDHSSKIVIERYIKSLEGLRWSFVRPGFFMENFDGTIGRITTTVLSVGMGPNTKLQLIASDDIGPVALAMFLDSEAQAGQAVPVIGDSLTTSEIAEAYRRGSGRTLPGIPRIAARAILASNKHTKELIKHIERVAQGRDSLPETREDLIANCRKLYPGMKTLEDWARARGASSERPENWNNVSLLQLILGKR